MPFMAPERNEPGNHLAFSVDAAIQQPLGQKFTEFKTMIKKSVV